MFSPEEIQMILRGIGETLYMSLTSTVLGYVIGLPMGVLLAVTGKDGIKPNGIAYKVIDIIANVIRSIPFIIFIVILLPFTRALLGFTTGPSAAVVPLTLAAAPFIARMVESSLQEVDEGVIEAAKSMGASNGFIIRKVLLVESRVSLITGATITLVTVIGYSAIAGAIGAGGLGDIAIQYGYYRYQMNIMWVAVLLLMVMVLLFQTIGTLTAKHLDKRK